MSTNLIGIYSPVMGSGKTSLTDVLVTHGWTSVKFAGTLKAMIRCLLSDMGYPGSVCDRGIDGDLKNDPIPQLGVTPRYLMQTLGSEWGRGQVKESLWVDIVKAKVAWRLGEGARIVIDDMRFKNEYDLVKELGGVTVKVVRPGIKDATGHRSEGSLDGQHFDYVLMNGGSFEEWQGLAFHFHEKLKSNAASA